MAIRKLNKEDVQAFLHLRIEVAQTSPYAFYPNTEELSRSSIAELEKHIVGSPLSFILGEFVNETLIAMVGVRRESMQKVKHKAVIWGVYTQESHRRQGVARKLMDVAISAAKCDSETTMLFLAVHSQNIAAKALYASLGFVSYGVQQNSMLVNGEYIHEDLMELNLAGAKLV